MSRIPSSLRRLASCSLPRYLVTGGVTSALDFGLFVTFSVGLKFPALLANVCSTTITICVSYLLNLKFVFKVKRASLKSFFSFSGLTLFTGLVLQSAVILGVLEAIDVMQDLPLDQLANPIAKIIAMAVGATCNYIGYRYLFTRAGKSIDNPDS